MSKSHLVNKSFGSITLNDDDIISQLLNNNGNGYQLIDLYLLCK